MHVTLFVSSPSRYFPSPHGVHGVPALPAAHALQRADPLELVLSPTPHARHVSWLVSFVKKFSSQSRQDVWLAWSWYSPLMLEAKKIGDIYIYKREQK